MRRRTGTKYIPVHRQEKGVDSKVSTWEKIGVISNIILSVLTLVVTINLTAYQNRLSEIQAEISQKQLEIEEQNIERETSPWLTFHDLGNKVEIRNNGSEILNSKILISKHLNVTVRKDQISYDFSYNYPFYYNQDNDKSYKGDIKGFVIEKNNDVKAIEEVKLLFETELNKKLDSKDIDYYYIVSFDLVTLHKWDYLGKHSSSYYRRYDGLTLQEFESLKDAIGGEPVVNLKIDYYDLESTYRVLSDDILSRIVE